jgi:hypothetical protein
MATNNETINLKIQVDANQAQQSTTNYKAKIKELKDQMAELLVETNGLADATAEQRAQYESLAKEAGSLTDALGDVSARIRANADDYQMFNAALEGLKGGAAVAQGLVGTLDLLGLSNSGVEQVVKTLMSLQGIMNSINAVQQVFNKDSKVRIALQKLLSTEVKKTAVAEGEATLASGALALGEGVATKATFTLAGACKAVGTAIKNIPVIGWILAAVSALIALTKLVVSLIDISDEGLEQQKQAEENQHNINEAYAEGERAIAKERRELELNIQTLKDCEEGTDEWNTAAESVAKTLGVGVEWIKKNKDKVNELALAWLNVKKVQATQDKLLEKMAENDVKVLQLEIAKTEIMGAHYKTRRETVERWAEVFGWSQDQIDELVDATNKTKTSNEEDYRNAVNRMDAVFNQSKKVLATATNTYQAEFDKLEKSIKDDKALLSETVEESKQVDEQLAKNHKKTNEQIKKSDENLAKERQKHLEALTKANKTASDKISGYWKTYDSNISKDNEETHFGRLENLSIEYAKTIDTLDKELAEYKDYYNKLSDEDKAALGDQLVTLEQFEKAQEGIRKQALDNYVKGIEKENEVEKKNEVEKQRRAIDSQNNIDNAVLAKRLANLQEGSEEYFELQKEIEEERFEQEMEDLRRREEDGEITKEELRALELEKEAEHQRNLTAIQEEEDRKRIELTQNRISTVGSILTNMSNFVSTLMEMELEEAEGNEKKQKEIKKKYATAQAVMKIGQIGIDTALGIMGVWSQVMELGPIAGPILGAILSATIGALGAANTVKAIQEKNKIMKAARGAYVVGASHTSGGVNYELEGGEIVLNKNVARIPQYRAIASAMNVSTGGIPLGGGGLENGAGFGVTKEDVQTIVQQTVAGIAAIPVVVSAQTISERQRQVNVTEQRSQI